MKSAVIIFVAFAIYAVVYGIMRALFGEGELSVAGAGILGTVILLAFMKAVGAK